MNRLHSKKVLIFVFIFAVFVWLSASQVVQTAGLELTQNSSFPDFPRAIDFSLIGRSDQPIDRAILTVGSNGRSCTTAQNEIELSFEPTQELNLTANWNVTQGTIFPLGAEYWWQWSLIDTAGNLIETERQTGIFEDDWFVWESAERENVTIHWYRGGSAYAEELLGQAIDARDTLSQQTGLLLDNPVKFYLFVDPRDLGASLPGAPGWAGGVAFPDHNIMMVAANDTSEAAADYGRLTTRHEFGHLVIGSLTFNCLTSLPTWLNEGLAQVAEGPADPRNVQRVAEAAENGQLPSLSTLEGNFSIHGNRAGTAYAQSDQFTRFLLAEWGGEKMLNLLETITAGNTIDDALLETYGLSKIELENLWRAEIGAEPLADSAEAVSPTATPPTVALLGIPTEPAPTETPLPKPTETVVPTLTPTQEPTPVATAVAVIVNESVPDIEEVAEEVAMQEPPQWVWLFVLLGVCFVIGLTMVGFNSIRRNRTE